MRKDNFFKFWVCCGLLMSVCLVAFSPVFTDDKSVAPMDIQESFIAPWSEDANGSKPHNQNPSDAVTQYLPYRMFAERSFAEDGYLGWNPYSMGGSNLAGNTMALPGSWTTHLHRFLPFDWAWNTGIIAEFLIAGIGMLTFLRSRKLPWIVCLFGAIAYMGNSQFITWINHRWALGAFCWIPWAFWSASISFNWRRLSARQLLLPVFISLALLGGSLQHMVFVVLACGFFMLGSWTNLNPLKNDWSLALKWSAVFALSFGIVAFSLVPQVSAYLTNGEVGHTRGGIGYPGGLSQPFLSIIAIPAQFWPWLMGDPQTIDGSKLLKLGFMNIAYFGTIPMILSIVGLFHKSMPRQAKWLIVAGLVIPLTPLVGPLYHRVQLLFILGGVWMAAEMLAFYYDHPPKKLTKYLGVAVVSIGLGLIVASMLPSEAREAIETKVVAKSLAVSDELQFGEDKQWIESRARAWTDRFAIHNPRTLWVYSLLVIGGVGVYFLSRDKHGFKYGTMILVGVVSLELGTFFTTFVTFSDSDSIKPGHPSVDRVAELAGDNLVFQGSGYTSLTNTFAAPNILSSYMVQTLDAYESIQYRSSSFVLRDLLHELRYTLSGVGIAIRNQSLEPYPGTEQWPVVEQLGEFELRRNPNALNPVLAVQSEGPIPIDSLLPTLKKADPIEPSLVTMNRLEFRVPEGSNWVRIARNWHPGWLWRIKGQEAWVTVVDGIDGMCWIPCSSKGDLQLEMKFHPRARWSVIVTTICLTFLALLFFAGALHKAMKPQRI